MGFKDVMKGIGKVALKAAPIAASFIPGVGPLAGMAIGAGTSALSKKLEGGSMKDSLLAGAGGAVQGMGGKGLGPSGSALNKISGAVAGMAGNAGVQAQGGKLDRVLGAAKGIAGQIGQMRGQGGQQQPLQNNARQPQQPMQAPQGIMKGQMMGRRGPSGMNPMGSAGIGPSNGPSFGNDASGMINRRNPTMNPDMEFVQGGKTGGYLDGVGETIGQGRSTTPALAKQQMLQAERQGVPASFIQSFLARNPGDTNRILEGYGAENPQFQGGSWQNYAMPSEEEANASQWGQQNIGLQGYDSVYGSNPQFGNGGGQPQPQPQYGGGGGGRMMPQMPRGGNQDPYATGAGGMEQMPQMNPGMMPQQMMGNRARMMGRRSNTQGRMGIGIGPSSGASGFIDPRSYGGQAMPGVNY